MIHRSIYIFVFLGTCLVESVVIGAETDQPRVPGYERFYVSPPTKPADEDEEIIPLAPVTGGRILLGELNCVSCHAPGSESATHITLKQAPILDGIGNRVKVEWLRDYLENPHRVKPGTTMPNMIETLPEEERSSSIEAITNLLASTGTIVDGRPDPTAAKKGTALFRKVGCLACHNSLEVDSPILATSTLLPDLEKKYTAKSLAEFLKDPLKTRPSGRMPNLGLSDEEYRNLAHHFVRSGNTNSNVKYSLFHGSWTRLPDFSELMPVAEGVAAGFDIAVADQPNEYAVRFESYLQISSPGDYEFSLGSDDGSKLSIDDEIVVNCDGIHPHDLKSGRATLSAGFHKVDVTYFQGGGEASLEVQISGKGMSKQPLSGFLYLEPKVPDNATSQKHDWAIDPQLVSKGRELFASIGCASCHQLKIDGQLIASELKAKPLSDIAPNQGCLSDGVTGKAPRYRLSSAQKASLKLAIESREKEDPSETIHRTLASLNCYACHQRGKLGGVELERDDVFESLQKEMGEEGRLPPILTGVGDKLRPEWLRQILTNGASDRKNYMVTKMPRFGAKNVESLVDQFAKVDLHPDPLPKADFKDPEYRVKASGRHLVGGQALSCIKCHDFGQYSSTGVRAINLTTMYQRLRPEWFYRYVLDPQAYRRGTRMPAPWPSGQVTIRDILNADANLQVQGIWLYLSDREKAAIPVGLVREPIELKPVTAPIIYRNFIEGAGTRAIGVGYPEGVNLAFDANNMRLAMIWQGAFIDASRHWTGRGQGFESPLGDNVIQLPTHVPFVKLDQPDREIPKEVGREIGYKFLGYQLDPQQRPIFRYSFDGLMIEDSLSPVQGHERLAALKRTLRFVGEFDTSQIWYRAAAAKKIEEQGTDDYRLDGIWNIRINVTENLKPLIRDSGGTKELLVPVRVRDGKAEFVMQYTW